MSGQKYAKRKDFSIDYAILFIIEIIKLFVYTCHALLLALKLLN